MGSTAAGGVRRRDHSSFVFRTATGKVGGRLRTVAGRGVLYKRVDRDRHQLTTPPAWACDLDMLDEAQRAGARYVLLCERGSDRWWAAAIVLFRSHGLRLDRGHGVQLALPLRWWSEGFAIERVLAEADAMAMAPHPAPVAPKPEVRTTQIALFAG